jgi:hypothetical protein
MLLISIFLRGAMFRFVKMLNPDPAVCPQTNDLDVNDL